MTDLLKSFATGEDGSAVIDWVVLLASSVLLALAVVMTVTENVDSITSNTADQMTSMEVNPSI